jgi:histidine ammonia-lyase
MNGKKVAAIQALKKHNLAPVKLRSKEGLALINGTQFMGAYGAWLLMKGKEMMRWADAIAGLSFEAFDGILAPFDDRIHQIRPHYGQIYTAAFFRQMLKGSKMAAAKKTQVQDPYSFRCIPQVHGATKDVWNHVEGVFNIELNSVTDNPNIFPDDNEVISGGNFHGQVLALALDYLCIAMHELGNISERRIYLLVSGQRGLPPFLAPNAGLNSGFMIPQYTAAGIVSQNKQWCTPASADSIVSSNGQEDHVSMGANAATKAYKVVENLESILSIELLTAAQAFNFRRPATSSKYIEQLHHSFRAEVKFIEEDVYMHEYMQRSLRFIKSHQLPDVKIAKVS